jgi:HAD superfamily hydrolase (TIGR01549 family)
MASPISNARLTGLIFDCDGVLFDSKEANTAYYNHIRFSVQLPPMTEEEAAYSHMVSTDEALERMIPENLKLQAIEARDKTKYRDTFMALMQPSPYMYEFLRTMKALGVPMALCTNRSDSVHHVLNYFSLAEFFFPVMTITHAHPKPVPDGLLKILDTWGIGPDTVAFLGDSLVDQHAATAAGVPFWSFNNPDLQADLHVSAFKKLDEVLSLMFMRRAVSTFNLD